ncbi:MAG: hypothetical protein ABIW19_02590 [Vicinamibacterales bacterium]
MIRPALTLVLPGMACGAGPGCADGVRDAMRATFLAKVTATDPMVFVPTISVGTRRWHPRGRRPRPSCISNRSDRQGSVGGTAPGLVDPPVVEARRYQHHF